MTNEGHNKALGIMHLAYGGINFLTLLMIAGFLAFGLAVDPSIPWETTLIALVAGVGFVLLNLFFTVPHAIAGYAILKRKSWARVPALIAALFSALNVPLGTCLTAYTCWFIFGEGGRRWESQFRYSLNDAPPPPALDWLNSSQERRHHDEARPREYAPPVQPPDWRN